MQLQVTCIKNHSAETRSMHHHRPVMMARRLLLALLAGSAAFVLPAAARAEAVINLYSSRHYDTDEALYDTFTKQTGIPINRLEATEDQLIQRMKAEGSRSPADVLITVDAGRLWRDRKSTRL